MKESLRRVILFTVIVVTGSVMILFDVPLIVMLPLILAVGLVILLLLGAITVADIRSALKTLNIQNLRKIKILKRLDEMKFFEKKSRATGKKTGFSLTKDYYSTRRYEKNRDWITYAFFFHVTSFSGHRDERTE
jgi:ABC-type bacteriocin/lantibiotic exporter with double-glycine peptidase domain